MKIHVLSSGLLCGLISSSAFAQPANTATSDLAKKLANSVASLTSVPFQYNYDSNIGLDKKGAGNTLIVQPFVSYVTPDTWTYSLITHSTFNCDARHAESPLNATVSELLKLGEVHVSFHVGARYYLSSVPRGPSGLSGRARMTFVFQKQIHQIFNPPLSMHQT